MARKATAQSSDSASSGNTLLTESPEPLSPGFRSNRSAEDTETLSSANRVGDSFWISASRGLLLTLMLSYFGALILVMTVLLAAVVYLRDFYTGLTGFTLLMLGVQLILGVGWLVTMRRFMTDLRGLFTSQHDSSPEPDSSVFLSPERYDQLYSAVGEVARDVEAPQPTQIHISPRAECYMLEDRSRDTTTPRRVLVLGFPHLLVFTVEQLKVIVGHELVHLRYGDVTTGLFVYRFLESLRVTIVKQVHSSWRLVNPLYALSKFYLGLLLWLSAPIQRRQELRADRHSARVYGGQQAAETLLQDWLLTSQFESNLKQYRSHVDAAEVSSQLGPYRWFLDRWQEFSSEGRAYLSSRLAQEEETDSQDTHPTMQARLDTMHEYPSGSPISGQPAHRLIHDLARLEKQLSESLNGS